MILDEVEAAGFPADFRWRWLVMLDFIEAVHMVDSLVFVEGLMLYLEQSGECICNDHSSYRVDRVPIDFHEYICVDT